MSGFQVGHKSYYGSRCGLFGVISVMGGKGPCLEFSSFRCKSWNVPSTSHTQTQWTTAQICRLLHHIQIPNEIFFFWFIEPLPTAGSSESARLHLCHPGSFVTNCLLLVGFHSCLQPKDFPVRRYGVQ